MLWDRTRCSSPSFVPLVQPASHNKHGRSGDYQRQELRQLARAPLSRKREPQTPWKRQKRSRNVMKTKSTRDGRSRGEGERPSCMPRRTWKRAELLHCCFPKDAAAFVVSHQRWAPATRTSCVNAPSLSHTHRLLVVSGFLTNPGEILPEVLPRPTRSSRLPSAGATAVRRGVFRCEPTEQTIGRESDPPTVPLAFFSGRLRHWKSRRAWAGTARSPKQIDERLKRLSVCGRGGLVWLL